SRRGRSGERRLAGRAAGMGARLGTATAADSGRLDGSRGSARGRPPGGGWRAGPQGQQLEGLTEMTVKRTILRYGETPEPVTPYQKAAQVWDERIGSARVQAYNWRLMALGSLMLSLMLAAILLWVGRSGSTTPYIVEVDPRGGARAVGPPAEAYKPSDAQ